MATATITKNPKLAVNREEAEIGLMHALVSNTRYGLGIAHGAGIRAEDFERPDLRAMFEAAEKFVEAHGRDREPEIHALLSGLFPEHWDARSTSWGPTWSSTSFCQFLNDFNLAGIAEAQPFQRQAIEEYGRALVSLRATKEV